MRAAGATRFYAKQLAPNDNSKNQVYLGNGFGALNLVPHGPIETDFEVRAGSVRRRDKASVEYYWIDNEGLWKAPDTKLILYPRYPEVRMSGFLLSVARAPRDIMASRQPGRILFLGICPDNRVGGHAVGSEHPTALQFAASGPYPQAGVFLDVSLVISVNHLTPRELLLAELLRIHQKNWIAGKRLHAGGIERPYAAQNGGGYSCFA